MPAVSSGVLILLGKYRALWLASVGVLGVVTISFITFLTRSRSTIFHRSRHDVTTIRA
jgi:hypothetical protein